VAKRKTKFKKIYCLDTNIILNEADNIFTLSDNGDNLIVLSETVLDEIDAKKMGLSEIAYQAREFGRIYNDAEVLQVDRASNKKLVTIHSKAYKDGRYVYIDVISKKKYDSDNDNSIDPKIKNDRKIIEIARDVQTEHANTVFISLDTMARNRALSIGLDVQTINANTKRDIVLSYKLQFEKPEINYSIFDIYSMDVPKTVQHLEITSKEGKPFYYYKTGSLFVLIDEDILKKQEVPPINMGQKVLMSQMLDEYYDVVVSDSLAGCVLPGTSVNISFDEKYVDNRYLELNFGLSKEDLLKLRRKKLVQYTKITNKKIRYNLSSFTPDILKYLKLDLGQKVIYNNDKKYNSKYLKLRYWLKSLDINDAVNKTIRLRRHYMKYFDYDLDEFIKLGYKPNELRNHIIILQNKILNIDNLKTPVSNRSKDFWLWRGYTEKESIDIVSKIQSVNSKYRADVLTKEQFREQSVRCKSFWIKKGYTEEEARQKVKEVQTTFSLDICTEKYGEEEGLKIFKTRQDKWQNTLKSKPQEEIDRINKSKGTQKNSDIPNYGSYSKKRFLENKELANSKGYIYYIRFIHNNEYVYKIGITKDLYRRISSFKNSELLWFEENTLLACFTKEQYVLTKYSEHRISIKNISTELFDTDIRIINE